MEEWRMQEIFPLYTSGSKGFSDEPLVELDYRSEGRNIKIKIRYFFPGFTISDDKRSVFRSRRYRRWHKFQEVKISGAGFLSQDQEPLLPSFGRFVQIPSSYGVVDVTSRKYCRKGKNKVLLTWAEENVSHNETIEFDEKKYQLNRFWPSSTKNEDEIVEVSNPHYFYMDGYKTVLVHVRPLQYNPRKKLLRGYGKVIVTITAAPMQMTKKKRQIESALTTQPDFLEGFSNLLLNPGRELFINLLNLQKAKLDVSAKKKKIDLLIIYADNLARPAKKLKQWKVKRGLLTEVIAISKVGNTPEHIKKYIRDKKINHSPRLRYVLLLGDVDKIVMSQDDENDKKYTDHYFYTHKDAGDSECILPFVSGGRIPVTNESEGMRVVEKIIRYETKETSDSTDQDRVALAAYFEDCISEGGTRTEDGRSEVDSVESMEDIRAHLICRGYKVSRAYLSQAKHPTLYRDGTPVSLEVKEKLKTDKDDVTTQIVACINNGQRIVSQTGHGNSDGWVKPPLKVEDLQSISTDKASVFFNITCLTGQFRSGLQKKCFAEELLTMEGIAASVVAANYNSQRWRNYSMVKALFDAICPGIISRFPKDNESNPVKYHRLGDILNYAKAYLLVKHGYNKLNGPEFKHRTKEQIEIYHVIGDPTLEIRYR
jgi:hypothetical protein